MEKQRILLVVRDPQNVDELKKVLISSGYEVKLADNGASALAICQEFRPNLVLAEIDLPKLDGHHLLRELKSQSNTKNIPFILMSRHRSVEERVHSINLGIDDYITTPFEVEEVILRIQNVLAEIERLDAAPTQHVKGFTGKLSELNVVELVQTLEIAQKSCIVSIQHRNDEGILCLQKGEVIDASLNNLNARKALFRMFTWNEGSFQVEIKETDNVRILKEKTSDLVRQGLIFKDRWNKLAANFASLQVTVQAAPKLSKEEYSNEELSILNTINGNTRIVDLIHKSSFDDLTALQIIAKLFYQGSLREVALQENLNGHSAALKNGESKVRSEEHLFKLVGNFLDKEKDKDPGWAEQMRNNRPSGLDRKTRDSHEMDSDAEKNQIYLNKSELLMIREKLSNGKAS
ncbi:MAG: response regulator [bacterium]